MFLILLFYIPLVISNEYLKEYIIIKAIHKGQTNIKVFGNSIEEAVKNKATIVNNIHKGVYPISRPELYAYSDMQFINESMENLNNMNSIIKDYRLIIIRDGEKSMIMNN